MKIGKNLKILREQKGLSLRGLQRHVGISHNTLGAYERCRIQPTIENYFKLTEFFEVPVEYLAAGERCDGQYRDIELTKLFAIVEKLRTEDRKIIKKYLKRYIKARTELEELKKEIEDL